MYCLAELITVRQMLLFMVVFAPMLCFTKPWMARSSASVMPMAARSVCAAVGFNNPSVGGASLVASSMRQAATVVTRLSLYRFKLSST